MVGCNTPADWQRGYVENIGFLDKSKPEDMEKLQRAYRECICLLLPSRAEAFGLVFAEAAAFGRPSIAFRTGGVGTAVLDGRTGLLLRHGSDASDFANAAERLLTDRDYLVMLSRNAREDYEVRLNWDAWSRRLVDDLESRCD